MLSAEQVLQYFRFNGPSAPVLPCGVFVVGSTDRFRHTVNSQMIKSASLIHALVNSQQLDRRRTVGVLGGGSAGVMAGLRAAELAAQATVFEKQDNVLSTFENASQRWLAPRLFDWPLQGWGRELTELPILNWQFGPANQIAQLLRDEAERLKNVHSGRFMVETGADVRLVMEKGRKPLVIDTKGRVHEFDIVVVTAGFGVERVPAGGKRYWDLDEIGIEKSSGTVFVVVGVGDGGLMDSLRVRLRGFDERVIMKELFPFWKQVSAVEYESVCEAIRGFESSLKQNHGSREIAAFYSGLDTPSIEGWFKGRLRDDTRLVLASLDDSPYSFQSAPINRFLFSRLQKYDRPGKLRYESARFSMDDEHSEWTLGDVKSGELLAAGSGVQTRTIHPRLQAWGVKPGQVELVVRTGVQPPLESISKDLETWSKAELGPRSMVDPHRSLHLLEREYQSAAILPARPKSERHLRRKLESDPDFLARRIQAELASIRLSETGVHEPLVDFAYSDRVVKRRRHFHPVRLPDELKKFSLRNGARIGDYAAFLENTTFRVAISPLCLGAIALFEYLNRHPISDGCKFPVDTSRSLAVEHLSGPGNRPPALVVGHDGVLVQGELNHPRYMPVLSFSPIQLALFSEDERSKGWLPETLGLPNKSTNTLEIADEAVVKAMLPETTNSWLRKRTLTSREHVPIEESREWLRTQSNRKRRAAILTYEPWAALSSWLGLGHRIPWNHVNDLPKQVERIDRIPGVVLMRSDLYADPNKREAILAAIHWAHARLQDDQDAVGDTLASIIEGPQLVTNLHFVLGSPQL